MRQTISAKIRSSTRENLVKHQAQVLSVGFFLPRSKPRKEKLPALSCITTMSSAVSLARRCSAANDSSRPGPVRVSQSTLESLPQEMLQAIVDQLPGDAVMLLKLGSHAMNCRIGKPVLTRSTWSQYNTTYGWSHRRQGLKERACHFCFWILPIPKFTDEQHDIEKVKKACCLGCMIEQGEHEFGGSFAIQGVSMWVCHGCHEPHPHASSAPRRMECSEKAWCSECWKHDKHLAEPQTHYPEIW